MYFDIRFIRASEVHGIATFYYYHLFIAFIEVLVGSFPDVTKEKCRSLDRPSMFLSLLFL